MKQFEHLNKLLRSDKTVLILGSGYVVPPVIEYFEKINRESNDTIIKIIIGTNAPEEAERQYENIEVIGLDVTKDKILLDNIVSKSDIVIRYYDLF